MSTKKDLPVTLTESDIAHAGTLQSRGKVVKTTITSPSAQSIGFVADKKAVYPVIVSNTYGRGRVVLFAFDLLRVRMRGSGLHI